MIGPGEVLLQVEACGIDGTDLKLLDGFGYTPKLPFIMGHEPAGIVLDVAADVTDYQPGDYVIPYIFLIPPDSPWYQSAREQLCPEMDGVLGVKGAEGGYAELMKVPARQLIRVPNTIAFQDAAVLCDAGLTAYHAVGRAQIRLGETVLVIGVGGVGSFAVQFAKLAGARVIAVDRSAEKAEHARQMGADTVIDASQQDVVESIQQETNGLGVDCVLDVVGQTATMTAGVESLRPGGRLVIVGYTPDDFSVAGKRLAQNELEVIGSRGGTRADLQAAVDLAAGGQLKSIVTETRPFSEVNEALDQLRSGNVLGRLVLDMSQ
jgi:alcohol dehydrogenase, propanol-preferring